jgi:hypothetical protein
MIGGVNRHLISLSPNMLYPIARIDELMPWSFGKAA